MDNIGDFYGKIGINGEELFEIREIIDIRMVDNVVEREREKQEAMGIVEENIQTMQQPEIILGIGEKQKKNVLIVESVLLLMLLLAVVLAFVFYFALYLRVL